MDPDQAQRDFTLVREPGSPVPGDNRVSGKRGERLRARTLFAELADPWETGRRRKPARAPAVFSIHDSDASDGDEFVEFAAETFRAMRSRTGRHYQIIEVVPGGRLAIEQILDGEDPPPVSRFRNLLRRSGLIRRNGSGAGWILGAGAAATGFVIGILIEDHLTTWVERWFVGVDERWRWFWRYGTGFVCWLVARRHDRESLRRHILETEGPLEIPELTRARKKHPAEWSRLQESVTAAIDDLGAVVVVVRDFRSMDEPSKNLLLGHFKTVGAASRMRLEESIDVWLLCDQECPVRERDQLVRAAAATRVPDEDGAVPARTAFVPDFLRVERPAREAQGWALAIDGPAVRFGKRFPRKDHLRAAWFGVLALMPPAAVPGIRLRMILDPAVSFSGDPESGAIFLRKGGLAGLGPKMPKIAAELNDWCLQEDRELLEQVFHVRGGDTFCFRGVPGPLLDESQPWVADGTADAVADFLVQRLSDFADRARNEPAYDYFTHPVMLGLLDHLLWFLLQHRSHWLHAVPGREAERWSRTEATALAQVRRLRLNAKFQEARRLGELLEAFRDPAPRAPLTADADASNAIVLVRREEAEWIPGAREAAAELEALMTETDGADLNPALGQIGPEAPWKTVCLAMRARRESWIRFLEDDAAGCQGEAGPAPGSSGPTPTPPESGMAGCVESFLLSHALWTRAIRLTEKGGEGIRDATGSELRARAAALLDAAGEGRAPLLLDLALQGVRLSAAAWDHALDRRSRPDTPAPAEDGIPADALAYFNNLALIRSSPVHVLAATDLADFLFARYVASVDVSRDLTRNDRFAEGILEDGFASLIHSGGFPAATAYLALAALTRRLYGSANDKSVRFLLEASLLAEDSATRFRLGVLLFGSWQGEEHVMEGRRAFISWLAKQPRLHGAFGDWLLAQPNRKTLTFLLLGNFQAFGFDAEVSAIIGMLSSREDGAFASLLRDWRLASAVEPHLSENKVRETVTSLERNLFAAGSFLVRAFRGMSEADRRGWFREVCMEYLGRALIAESSTVPKNLAILLVPYTGPAERDLLLRTLRKYTQTYRFDHPGKAVELWGAICLLENRENEAHVKELNEYSQRALDYFLDHELTVLVAGARWSGSLTMVLETLRALGLVSVAPPSDGPHGGLDDFGNEIVYDGETVVVSSGLLEAIRATSDHEGPEAGNVLRLQRAWRSWQGILGEEGLRLRIFHGGILDRLDKMAANLDAEPIPAPPGWAP